MEFKPHRDGNYLINKYIKSMFTILIYLSDSFEGGETSFINGKECIDIKPSIGSAVIFPHGDNYNSPVHS
jgi:hypothetical protein